MANSGETFKISKYKNELSFPPTCSIEIYLHNIPLWLNVNKQFYIMLLPEDSVNSIYVIKERDNVDLWI